MLSVTDIFISPNVTIPALFDLFDQSFYGAFLSEIIHILDLRMNTRIEQVKQGWDGHVWTDEDIGDRQHKPVTAQMCNSYIDHCVKELEAWLKANVGKLNAEFQPGRLKNLKSN